MKRLLAYLFIVLGLGLTFSVSGNAETKSILCHPENIKWKCLTDWTDHPKSISSIHAYVVFKDKKNTKEFFSVGGPYKIQDSNSFKSETIERIKEATDKCKNFALNNNFNTNKCKSPRTLINLKWKRYGSDYFNKRIFYKPDQYSSDRFANEAWNLVNLSQKIAKKEPSQTQKVARKNIKYPELLYFPDINSGMKLPNIANEGDVYKFLVTNLTNNSKWFESINSNKNIAESEALNKCKKYFKDTNTDDACLINSISILNENSNNIVKQYFVWDQQKLLFYDKTKTQIAKAEPSQTQNVAKKEDTKQEGELKTWKVEIKHPLTNDIFKSEIITKDKKVAINNALRSCYKFVNSYNKKNPEGKLKTKHLKGGLKKNTQKISTTGYSDCKISKTFEVREKTQIAKAEPTIKPKKKVEVAKVEEPKQEEFKPKKTNQDNEAPVITIAEVITVNDTDYEFQGKVTDQAKTIYVEVDGRPTDVKNGKFIVKGYSPIDKQISIEAIDQWGNRSEPKIVKLTIDIKDTSIAEKIEPLNPSKIKTKSSNNKVALIIGIENYLESPNAKYANLDAKYFFDYARKGFGVKKQNINLLVDEQATFVKTNKALTKWLRSKIKSGQSDLIIFFAGHGLASSDGKELYLLPQDSDPDLLARTALSRTELFQEIINLNPKSVTMFLDTCYSGVSRDEQMLLASARPIRIVADEQSKIPNNFTIFSASKLDQISSGLKEAKHGIFSYYLMKGLEGNADINKDKKITNGELLAYMDQNVSQKASELGRQQNPSLAGDPNKILMSYR